MPEPTDSLPLVYAPDASGALRHAAEVPNGEACGCRCPAPDCGQPLVAKNGGAKRIHHLAHKRGTCAWAAENVIAALAARALGRAGRMAFPELSYHDACGRHDAVLSPARALPVVAASAEFLSGRRAPEVVVTCRSSAGDEKRFAIALCLVHSLRDAHVGALREVRRGQAGRRVHDVRRHRQGEPGHLLRLRQEMTPASWLRAE